MLIRNVFIALAISSLPASPASAQQNGVYVVDLSNRNETRSVAVAALLVTAAEDVADPAVVLCSTNDGDRGHYHREQMRARLVDAGALPQRILDVGQCTPQITGRSNDNIGEARVWVALSTVTFLEEYRRRTLGY